MNKNFRGKFPANTFGILLSLGLVLPALLGIPLHMARANSVTNKSAVDTQVGVVLRDRDNPYWLKIGNQFYGALTATGHTVTVYYSQNDTAIEKSNVETLISQGIQVLIICPVDDYAAAAAVQEARAAGVKVISFDRLIRNTPAVDFYLTFDNLGVGEEMGDYLISNATGTGNNLYLYAGDPGDDNSFKFFEGTWNKLQPKLADGTFVVRNSSEAVTLKNKPILTYSEQASIINQITTHWDPSFAAYLAQANLSAVTAAEKGNVFILAPNDDTARAIADAFAADPQVTSYKITGQDAVLASVQYIIDGKQSMTIFKDPRALIQDTVSSTIAYLEGGTPIPTTIDNNGLINVPAKHTATTTIDKNNIRPVLIDTGFYQPGDVTGITAPPSVS